MFLFADGTTTTVSTSTSTTSAAAITTGTAIVTVVTSDADSCAATILPDLDLDASVDEISVENVPRREEGFFHRLLSRRSTKKKTKSPSLEDVDVNRFLFDETMGARPRQREEPPPAGRMQLSYPPDLPPDHMPQLPPQSPVQHHHHHNRGPLAEAMFEPDTFAPLKQSFSLEPQHQLTDDETASSTGDGSSSVQKSSSSDSVSSAALDEPSVAGAADDLELPNGGAERCRSYSSSDSEHLGNGSVRSLPVPAPRLSKLQNGGGSGTGTGSADVVVRRRKRDEQQPELLKVFARRSLKLGLDGEPELLLPPSSAAVGDDGCVDHQPQEPRECMPDVAVEVATENADVVQQQTEAVATTVDENKHRPEPEVDVNENRTVSDVPRFKRIQQRREEWEKRLLQQQRN